MKSIWNKTKTNYKIKQLVVQKLIFASICKDNQKNVYINLVIATALVNVTKIVCDPRLARHYLTNVSLKNDDDEPLTLSPTLVTDLSHHQNNIFITQHFFNFITTFFFTFLNDKSTFFHLQNLELQTLQWK